MKHHRHTLGGGQNTSPGILLRHIFTDEGVKVLLWRFKVKPSVAPSLSTSTRQRLAWNAPALPRLFHSSPTEQPRHVRSHQIKGKYV